jgi:hypothetical protein
MIARVLLLLGAGTTGLLATAAAVTACSGPQNERIGIEAPPFTKASFGPVADYLGNRCGTLDCHGQVGRNLRIWGCAGMRASPDASPASCASPTTLEEYEDTYRSLVGLEPQVITTVYKECSGAISGGTGVYPPASSCHPELLTFMQKARGTQAHKGGQLICVQAPCPDGIPNPVQLDDAGPPVDPQDVCLVTWLEGATDTKACAVAFGIPNFPLPDAGTE